MGRNPQAQLSTSEYKRKNKPRYQKQIYNNFKKAINIFFHKNIYNLLAIIVHPFLLLLHNYILVPLLVESNFLR